MADSLRVGIGWGAEGPQAGFFPFYVGLLLTWRRAATVAAQPARAAPRRRRVRRVGALRRVLAVLIPPAVYVAAVRWLGIYVASALLIARLHARSAAIGYRRLRRPRRGDQRVLF